MRRCSICDEYFADSVSLTQEYRLEALPLYYCMDIYRLCEDCGHMLEEMETAYCNEILERIEWRSKADGVRRGE